MDMFFILVKKYKIGTQLQVKHMLGLQEEIKNYEKRK